LLKGIVLFFYKLAQGIYHMIFGKGGTAVPAPQQAQQEQPIPVATATPVEEQIVSKTPVVEEESSQTRFCSECGMPYTSKMVEYLKVNGRVYCEYCGKGIKPQEPKVEA